MNSHPPEITHRLKGLATLLPILVLLFAIAAICLAFRTKQYVPDWPLTEDGYYAYTVAYNIAGGSGITIDGSTLTNGFQPLFTFISVPIFNLAGGDKYLAVRYMILLHWVFYVGTAFLLGFIGLRGLRTKDTRMNKAIFWLITFTYIASSLAFRNHFNGLETGFYLFILALAWWYYQSGYLETFGGIVIFGILLGFVVLARIDSVFFVLIITVYLVVKNWKRRGFAYSLRFMAIPVLAFAVSSPWWYYNVAHFGSLMPTSGKAQQEWLITTVRVKEAISAFFQIAVQPTYTGPYNVMPMDIVRIALAVLGFISLRGLMKARYASAGSDSVDEGYFRRTVEFAGCLIVWVLALCMWYIVSSWVVKFYIRYFLPLILVSTLGIACLLAEIAKKRPKLVIAAVLILCMPLALTLMLSYSKGGIKLTETKQISFGSVWLRDQLKLVQENVPEEDYVAAVGSGTLGYFRERVVNLDGKVNQDALEYRGKLWEYLEMRDIKWLCDYRSYIVQILGEGLEEKGWRKVAERGRLELYYREDE